jgi:phage/plasmid-like protein (TIGR03299 family)
MGMEDMDWYNNMILVGNTNIRGNAWHYREDLQGDEPNHYPGFIPVDDVIRRLFNFDFVEAQTCYLYPGKVDGAITHLSIGDEWYSVVRSTQGRKGMLTSDTQEDIGSFKAGYRGHAYQEWLIDKVAALLSKNGHELGIGSAGLLQQRGQAWVSIETDETITTPEGVTYLPFISAMTSFNGTLATGYGAHTQQIVCDNTLEVARGQGAGKQYRIKHTKYSEMKIADARDALKIIFAASDDFAKEVANLTKWKVSDHQFEHLLGVMIPLPEEDGRGKTIAEKKRNEIINLYRADERAAPWRGTAFGVLQAFNTWNHHFATVKGKVPRGARNMENVLSGKFAAADGEVLDVLEQIAVPV